MILYRVGWVLALLHFAKCHPGEKPSGSVGLISNPNSLGISSDLGTVGVVGQGSGIDLENDGEYSYSDIGEQSNFIEAEQMPSDESGSEESDLAPMFVAEGYSDALDAAAANLISIAEQIAQDTAETNDKETVAIITTGNVDSTLDSHYLSDESGSGITGLAEENILDVETAESKMREALPISSASDIGFISSESESMDSVPYEALDSVSLESTTSGSSSEGISKGPAEVAEEPSRETAVVSKLDEFGGESGFDDVPFEDSRGSSEGLIDSSSFEEDSSSSIVSGYRSGELGDSNTAVIDEYVFDAAESGNNGDFEQLDSVSLESPTSGFSSPKGVSEAAAEVAEDRPSNTAVVSELDGFADESGFDNVPFEDTPSSIEGLSDTGSFEEDSGSSIGSDGELGDSNKAVIEAYLFAAESGTNDAPESGNDFEQFPDDVSELSVDSEESATDDFESDQESQQGFQSEESYGYDSFGTSDYDELDEAFFLRGSM